MLAQFVARSVNIKHPIDAGSVLVSLFLPDPPLI